MSGGASAVLGSTLLEQGLATRRAGEARITTNHLSIDSALNGGIKLGQVISVAGNNGTGKTLVGGMLCYTGHADSIQLSLHVLASFLLDNDIDEAAIIDTTGSFDRRLLDVLVSRIESGKPDGQIVKCHGLLNS